MLRLQSTLGNDAMAEVAQLTGLTQLSLRGCGGLTGAPGTGFERLRALQSLRSLNLSQCTSLQARHGAVKVFKRAFPVLSACEVAALAQAVAVHLAAGAPPSRSFLVFCACDALQSLRSLNLSQCTSLQARHRRCN